MGLEVTVVMGMHDLPG